MSKGSTYIKGMMVVVGTIAFVVALAGGLFFTDVGATLIYLWKADRTNFSAAFQNHHTLLFFLVRVLPLLVAAVLLFLWLRKRVWWKKYLSENEYILFQVLFVFAALAVAELYLRGKNFYPNSFYSDCVPVQKVEDRSIQYCDSVGIIRYRQLNRWFPSFYTYINKDGFRCNYEYDSLTIVNLKKNGKLVMVIGDSFVDGASAEPRDSCFTDLLDAHPGYVALNFGQGGTDPLQYRLVAEQYVPKLKPDVVALVVYDNDIMQYGRKPTPGIPMYYQTNANYQGGWMEAQKPIEMGYAANDILKTPEEAYEFYSSFYTIPASAGWVGRWCAKTALTTRLWFWLNENRIKTVPQKKWEEGKPYTYENLKAIEEVCKKNNCPLVVFYIPHVSEIEDGPEKNAAEHKSTFRDMKIYYPSGIKVEDHVSLTKDTHFNNRGHARFADFMVKTLNAEVH